LITYGINVILTSFSSYFIDATSVVSSSITVMGNALKADGAPTSATTSMFGGASDPTVSCGHESELVNLRKSLEDSQKLIQQLDGGNLDNSSNHLIDLKRERDDALNALAAEKSANDLLRKDLDVLHETMKDKDDTLTTQAKQISRYDEVLHETHQQHSENKLIVAGHIVGGETILAERDALQKEVALLKHRLDSTSSHRDSLEDTLKAKKDNLASQQAELNSNMSDLHTVLLQCNELKSERDDLAQKNASREAELETKSSELYATMMQLHDAEVKVVDLESANRRQVEELLLENLNNRWRRS
jgi:septal ring factor EnvC (AmiA/AmiB activator)